MLSDYSTLILKNGKTISFGTILFFLSTPGQTYFLSLFVLDFQTEFQLSSAAVGSAFAGTTILAALVLPFLGGKIDVVPVSRYVWFVAAILAGSCFFLASAQDFLTFAVCLFLLRLCGQGLMIHTAVVATSRTLRANSGKAIALISLGASLPRIVVPSIITWCLMIVGWREIWGVVGANVIAGAALAVIFLLPKTKSQPRSEKSCTASRDDTGERSVWLTPRFLLACPALLAISFIWTGFLVHQVHLFAEKGWPAGLFAISFGGFAIVQVGGSLLAGWIIDSYGALRVIQYFLMPAGLGLILVFLFSGAWVAPVFLVLIAISAAIDLLLAPAVWVQLFRAEEFGRVRSQFEALRIAATGVAPFFLGVLIDVGVPLSSQALGCAVFVVAASGMTLFLHRCERQSH